MTTYELLQKIEERKQVKSRSHFLLKTEIKRMREGK